VVEGVEWPLNIVFRAGNSEDNAVAWREFERAVERQPLRPFSRQRQDRHMRRFSISRPKRPPLRTCGVDVTWVPSASPILTHGHFQFVSYDPKGWLQTYSGA
jgi:hypothetical protein